MRQIGKKISLAKCKWRANPAGFCTFFPTLHFRLAEGGGESFFFFAGDFHFRLIYSPKMQSAIILPALSLGEREGAATPDPLISPDILAI